MLVSITTTTESAFYRATNTHILVWLGTEGMEDHLIIVLAPIFTSKLTLASSHLVLPTYLVGLHSLVPPQSALYT